MDNRIKKVSPSMDEWMKEAKSHTDADQVGMYLFHNGVVRKTAKAKARLGHEVSDIDAMDFSFDPIKVENAIEKTYEMPGIHYIKVWLNEGHLFIGDDIMYVLVGGDIRPHVIDALQSLVQTIKTECVVETEITKNEDRPNS